MAWLIAGLGMLFALLVYLFFRTENTLVFIVFGRVFTFELMIGLKGLVRSFVFLPEWAVFSLPGALWMFAASIISGRWHIGYGNFRVRLDVFPPLAIVYFELMQFWGILNGFFDWDDLAWAGLIQGVYFLFFRCGQTFALDVKGASQHLVPTYAVVLLAHVC